ncbi:uncharacterized protein BKA78DRAFT_315527, partial [Phyllosticta capitalensis]|uniref:uncharacterized protein n=1 Tax=Phyllosticta capitalensis TaxID=121624 RepID=UPI00312ED91A
MPASSSGTLPRGQEPCFIIQTTITTTVTKFNLDTGEATTSVTNCTTTSRSGPEEDRHKKRRISPALPDTVDCVERQDNSDVVANEGGRQDGVEILSLSDDSDEEVDENDVTFTPVAQTPVANAPPGISIPVRPQQSIPAKRRGSSEDNEQIEWSQVTRNIFAKTKIDNEHVMVRFCDWPASLQDAVNEGLQQSTARRIAWENIRNAGRPDRREGVCFMSVYITCSAISADEAQASQVACKKCRNPKLLSRPCLTARRGGGYLLMPLKEDQTDLNVVGHWLVNH